MTAYGRGEHSHGEVVFIAEIKSLNNRYRDVIVRTPKTLQILEDEIRSLIGSRIKRGRIEVFIQMEKSDAAQAYNLELNLPLVKSYLQIFEKLSEEFGLDEKVSPDYLCQFRDVILFKPKELDVDEARLALQEVVGLALNSLDEMRLQEGRAIEEDFQKRLQLMEEHLGSIEERAPVVVEEYRKRLVDKIHKISQDVDVDENRVAQEVAIFADRCDVTEEIVRIGSHLQQFRNYMSMDDSIGRRLDFLIQEINREVNTISSKSYDSSISAMAVEIKAELEKLREQVQNVE